MSTAYASTFAQLRTVAVDPDVDLVYLTADITYDSSGILIPKNKPSLIIDGTYEGIVHTMTDYNNNAHSTAIRVAATSGAFELTLRNVTFLGRNFYGAISCVNSSLQSSTTLCLENVTYSGPQSSYNRYGTVIYRGGDYRIGQYNGTSSAVHELTEANKLYFDGEVTVHHDGSPNSCLYISEANPRLELLSGARVVFTVLQRELIYVDAATTLQVELGANSSLVANTCWSLFYSASMAAYSFYMREGAEFVLNQAERRSGVPTINIYNAFILERDTRLIVIRNVPTATEPIIRLWSNGCTAYFTDPKAVVLWSQQGAVIAQYSGTGNWAFEAQMIRYWTAAGTGDFDDTPLYHWQKQDQTNVTIFANQVGTSTMNVVSNIVVGVDAPVPPSSTSFALNNCRVLALGRLDVEADVPKDGDTAVSGSTRASSAVRARTQSQPYSQSTAQADGSFKITMGAQIQKNDTVTVQSNIDFLLAARDYTAVGSLRIVALPDRLPFRTVLLPVRSEIHRRLDDDWAIIVRDSRDGAGEWSLVATAPDPMSNPTDDLGDDALVFNTTSLHTPTVIYTGQGNLDPDHTDTTISWSALQGILLSLLPTNTYSPGEYTTPITFDLQD